MIRSSKRRQHLFFGGVVYVFFVYFSLLLKEQAHMSKDCPTTSRTVLMQIFISCSGLLVEREPFQSALKESLSMPRPTGNEKSTAALATIVSTKTG